MTTTFITDRTQADVDRVRVLAAKGWDNMSESEKKEWMPESGNFPKGAYNFTDLNRVETAVQELAGVYNLSLTTKTDWGYWDIPRPADMERYLGNIQAIRRMCSGLGGVPFAPETIEVFTYVEANNVEKILEKAYELIEIAHAAILGEMQLGMSVLGRKE